MEVSEKLKKSIEKYVNGDSSAFTTIYNESSKYIYVCVRNVLIGNDNAEDMIQDVVQDTFFEVSKHLNSLQNVDTYFSWVGTIATRKCYEYIKKANKYVLLNEDESFDNLSDSDDIIPEEIMQNKEKQRLIREIINDLTEMQRLCVIAYYYNEMKQSEIAKELGIPENTVKSNLLRAKSKIKEGVVDLEKKKGTKLYSIAPLLLLLFTDEVKECKVPAALGKKVLKNICNATVMSLGKRIGIGVTCFIAGAALIAGGVVAVSNRNDNEKTNPVGDSPELESGGASPEKETGGNLPEKETGGNLPEKETGGNSPEKETGGNSPEKETGGNSPEKETEGDSTEKETEDTTKDLIVIPEGITYYDSSNKVTLVAGEYFPEKVESNDEYRTLEYTYKYNGTLSLMNASTAYSTLTFVSEGWNVQATDNYSGGEILDTVLGYPVTDMIFTFYNMKDMVKSPKIPDTVKNMPYTYLNCQSLTSMPEIPDGVVNMEGCFKSCNDLYEITKLPSKLKEMSKTFENCYVLEESPDIPKTVVSMNDTYASCQKLTKAKKLPENLKEMDGIFSGCTSLTEVPEIPKGVTSLVSSFRGTAITIAPDIPYGVTNMEETFRHCSKLTKTPKIADTVVNMVGTFASCSSITEVQNLPANVENMERTFYQCKLITTVPQLPNSVTNLYYAFRECNSLITAPTIPSGVTDMTCTFFKCKALTGIVIINANPSKYNDCFGYINFDKQNFSLTGSSLLLEELKATEG